MRTTIPPEAQDLVESDVPAVVSYRDAAGRILSWPFWAEVVDGRVIISADRDSRKAAHLRRDPEVGILFLDRSDPERYLSVSGRVVEIRDDPDMKMIDRLSMRYQARPYTERDVPREVYALEISRAAYAPGASED
jgi:PPOX class probable F420-dependent enzyme